jgi:type III secretion protein R
MADQFNIASLLVTIVAVSLLPFFAMVVTSYTKISIVLGLLRNALGTQQVPPGMVTNGIALIVTCFIMAPVAMQAYSAAAPAEDDAHSFQITPFLDAAREPFRRFMQQHTSAHDKEFFLRSAREIWPPDVAAQVKPEDLIILAPAFMVGELTSAFKIGFLLYLIFIVIDLVVANLLMALGLSQVTPTNVAIPFKLLLFVEMDGWSMLVHGLISTYR